MLVSCWLVGGGFFWCCVVFSKWGCLVLDWWSYGRFRMCGREWSFIGEGLFLGFLGWGLWWVVVWVFIVVVVLGFWGFRWVWVRFVREGLVGFSGFGWFRGLCLELRGFWFFWCIWFLLEFLWFVVGLWGREIWEVEDVEFLEGFGRIFLFYF